MILSTKLHIPHSRSSDMLVNRHDLFDSLSEGMKAKLTLITAPAGYGKTTALGEWVRLHDYSVAWISLDRLDNDLIAFWTYVISAVESIPTHFGNWVSPPLALPHTGTVEPFVSAFIHELNGISGPFVIILDDYHTIELSTIHASLAFLLEYLPEHVHLYIASRSNVPFPTARLLAKGQMHKIDVRDLQFQFAEGIRFFHLWKEISLTDDDISLLISRTEGWVSGLQLAAVSLKRSADPANFIREFSGHHRDIASYLLEELYMRQSEEVQDFLLNTSILSRINSSLCEAVTGRTSCQEHLETLERLNLFIVPLDEHKGWYRYHHLFSDFLQQQLQLKYKAQWSELHAKAAHWLISQGLLEDAVEHLLVGHHYEESAALIETHMQDLQLKRTVLRRWLSALPERYIAEKPGLYLLYTKVLAEAGEVELAIARMQAAESKLTEPNWKPFAGTLWLLASEIALYQKKTELVSEYLEKFEESTPEGNSLQMIAGNTSQGVDYNSLLVFFKDMHAAEAFFLKWIKVWENKPYYPFIGYFYLDYGELMYEWNRLEEASHYFQRMLRQQQFQPFTRVQVRAAVGAAWIRRAQGDSDEAFRLLEQIKPKVGSPEQHVFLMKLEAEKTYLSLLEGSTNGIEAWLESFELKYTDSLSLHLVREYLHIARTLAACGKSTEALELLGRLYRLVEDADRLCKIIKVLILQAVVLHKQGDMQTALTKLEQALCLAEPQGYIRSFVDEGAGLANLLVQYLQFRQNSFIRKSAAVSLAYVKKLLNMMNVETDGTLLRDSLLTEQETRILRLLQQGLQNIQIAAELSVKPDTVKMHLKNMYRKLSVNSRMQALQRGKELNLL